jgi:hypothetical protein
MSGRMGLQNWLHLISDLIDAPKGAITTSSPEQWI